MTEQTLEQMMHDYTDYLLRIGYYYTKDINRSRDLVQDVFIQLYYSNYEDRGQAKAYLATMMRNRCLDYLKSFGYRIHKLQDAITKETKVVQEDTLIIEEERDALDAAILGLKVKYREVIAYYYLENMTTKEIASLLHTPESTIKTRLQTARQQLKSKLVHMDWEGLLNGTL